MMVLPHYVFACQEEYEEIIKYLVEHGANINKENNKG